MENEVRSAGTQRAFATEKVLEAGQLFPGSYETMRQSLEEAERRNEMLNVDMSKQVYANEELVESMATVKDANKRLLEQVRLQTEELTQLISQRVSDEERMDYVTMSHRNAHEAFRQDTQQQVRAVRQVSGERHDALRECLSEQLRYLRRRLELIGQDATALQEEQRQLRRHAAALAEAMRMHMEAAAQKAVAWCSDFSAMHAQRQEKSLQEVRDLQLQLRNEQEARQCDEITWGHELRVAGDEMEDVQARRARDLGQLTSQLQGLERMLSAERHAWAEEKGRLLGRCDEVASRQAEREQLLASSCRRRDQLEASIAEALAEARVREKAVVGLQQTLRESDDALAAAVSGNEHLRDQMEEQRGYFQDRNEADLLNTKDASEQRLNRARESHGADAGVCVKQLQLLDETLRGDTETCQLLQSQADAATLDCTALERQARAYQEKFEAASTERMVLEQVFGEARQKNSLDALGLQLQIDLLSGDSGALGTEIRKVEALHGEGRRAAGVKEAEHATQLRTAETELRDVREQLAGLKRRLLEATEGRTRVELEQAEGQQEALEAVASLERRIEECGSVAMQRKEGLTAALAEAKTAADGAKDHMQQECEAGPAMVRQAQLEGRSKLAEAEQNRARVEEGRRAELVEASEAVAQQRKRCSACEYDLGQLRSMLSRSQENLAHARQDFEREDRESAAVLRHAGDDARLTQSALDKALRDEAAMQLRREEVLRRNEQEQALLARELEEARRALLTKAAGDDVRIPRARPGLEESMDRPSDRTVLSIDAAQEEALLRENDRLRSLLTEQGRGSASLSAMQAKLEDHINRLQKSAAVAAAELRSGLRDATGRVVPGGVPLATTTPPTVVGS